MKELLTKLAEGFDDVQLIVVNAHTGKIIYNEYVSIIYDDKIPDVFHTSGKLELNDLQVNKVFHLHNRKTDVHTLRMYM